MLSGKLYWVGGLMLSLLLSGCASRPLVFETPSPSPSESLQPATAILTSLSHPIDEPFQVSLAGLDPPAFVFETIVKTEEGLASWYGPRFHGRKTANGERFNMNEMTAAHRNLPFNSRARITCLTTGENVVVRINDRGPYAHNRTLDLSKAAAEKLGMLDRGLTRVRIEVLASTF